MYIYIFIYIYINIYMYITINYIYLYFYNIFINNISLKDYIFDFKLYFILYFANSTDKINLE